MIKGYILANKAVIELGFADCPGCPRNVLPAGRYYLSLRGFWLKSHRLLGWCFDAYIDTYIYIYLYYVRAYCVLLPSRFIYKNCPMVNKNVHQQIYNIYNCLCPVHHSFWVDRAMVVAKQFKLTNAKHLWAFDPTPAQAAQPPTGKTNSCNIGLHVFEGKHHFILSESWSKIPVGLGNLSQIYFEPGWPPTIPKIVILSLPSVDILNFTTSAFTYVTCFCSEKKLSLKTNGRQSKKSKKDPSSIQKKKLRWWFQTFLFIFTHTEMIKFDDHMYQIGLVFQPPTSKVIIPRSLQQRWKKIHHDILGRSPSLAMPRIGWPKLLGEEKVWPFKLIKSCLTRWWFHDFRWWWNVVCRIG